MDAEDDLRLMVGCLEQVASMQLTTVRASASRGEPEPLHEVWRPRGERAAGGGLDGKLYLRCGTVAGRFLAHQGLPRQLVTSGPPRWRQSAVSG